MARKPYRALAGIDAKALASFQAGIRKRYSDDQILAGLRDSAERVNRSPTMRGFAADPETAGPPQAVIEHFARRDNDGLLTEWQVYRMFDARRGAWSTFQFLIREQLGEDGVEVGSDGRLV